MSSAKHSSTGGKRMAVSSRRDDEPGVKRHRRQQPETSVNDVLRDEEELYQALYFDVDTPLALLKEIGFEWKSSYFHPLIERSFGGADDIRRYLIRRGIPYVERLDDDDRLVMELWVRLAFVDRSHLTSARSNLPKANGEGRYQVRRLTKEDATEILKKSYGLRLHQDCGRWGILIGDSVHETIIDDADEIRVLIRNGWIVGGQKRHKNIDTNDALSLQLWAASSPKPLPKFNNPNLTNNDKRGRAADTLNNDAPNEDPNEPVLVLSTSLSTSDENTSTSVTSVTGNEQETHTTRAAPKKSVEEDIHDVEAEISSLTREAESVSTNIQSLARVVQDFNSFQNQASVLFPEMTGILSKLKGSLAKLEDEGLQNSIQASIVCIESLDIGATEEHSQALKQKLRELENDRSEIRKKIARKNEELDCLKELRGHQLEEARLRTRLESLRAKKIDGSSARK